MKWANQLVDNVENFRLHGFVLSNDFYGGNLIHTCNRCINKPMKDMKSTISAGAKCASKSVINVGMKSMTLDPVVATIRAKENRV